MMKKYCGRCGRLCPEDNFYYSNNLVKYPTGKLNICKDCITKNIDNDKPSTFLWILQECDVPYLPEEWEQFVQYQARLTFGQKKSNSLAVPPGRAVIGRYLSKMRLLSFKAFRWEDTQWLLERRYSKKREEEFLV